MQLTKEQRRELFNLLVVAFPAEGELRRMVGLELGAQVLTAIGGRTLQDQVFDLLQWAESHDKISGVITAAQAANPDYTALRDFALARGLSVVAAADASPTSTAPQASTLPTTSTHGGITFNGPTTISGPIVGGDVATLTYSANPLPLPTANVAQPPPGLATATPPADSTSATLYDVFVSYASADDQWVHDELVPALKGAGLRVCIDTDDFLIGMPIVDNIERAVNVSRYTVIVMTANWVASRWTDFEAQLVTTQDPGGKLRRLIPIMLIGCDPPLRISRLTFADFTNPARRPTALARLIGQLQDLIKTTP